MRDILLEWNRENIRKLIYILSGMILLFWGLQNLSLLFGWVQTGLGLLAPFLVGLFIAFVLNVPMHAIETRLLSYRTKQGKAFPHGLKRITALVLAICSIVAVVLLVIFLVVPELGRTIKLIQAAIPGFLVRLQELANELAASYPQLGAQILASVDWEQTAKTAMTFLRSGATSLLNSTFDIATSVFSGVFNFVLGFVFSVYLLLQNEKLSRQFKKLMYAFLPTPAVDKTLEVTRLSNRIFSKFFTGQCVEAFILGSLFFVSMLIFRLPYALMISVLTGFTALIPVFGAFIGCFIGTFLILVTDPIKAFWFLVLFLVLQQLEGNLIYPRVVGSSIGLPGIWVLCAVTIGGSTMGILGMLIMVPLCSVVYALLREAVGTRLQSRQIPTQKYMAAPENEAEPDYEEDENDA